jgi:hypothetical protein
MVEAYLHDRGVELHADAFLFCTRSGTYYEKRHWRMISRLCASLYFPVTAAG